MCVKVQLSGEAAKIHVLVTLFPKASCGSLASPDLPQRAMRPWPDEGDGVQAGWEAGDMA